MKRVSDRRDCFAKSNLFDVAAIDVFDGIQRKAVALPATLRLRGLLRITKFLYYTNLFVEKLVVNGDVNGMNKNSSTNK